MNRTTAPLRVGEGAATRVVGIRIRRRAITTGIMRTDSRHLTSAGVPRALRERYNVPPRPTAAAGFVGSGA
jgi:hypothetical protein